MDTKTKRVKELKLLIKEELRRPGFDPKVVAKYLNELNLLKRIKPTL